MTNPTSLEKLPAEILNYVLDLLPKDALANLRLASRYYQRSAKPYLYRHLTLRWSTESAARAREITQEESLAPFVREVTLQASRSTRVWNEDHHGRFLHDLRKFIRLRSLSIQFHPIMLQASLIYNSDFFATLFSAVMLSHFISCGLDRLSITNLQSRDEPFVTTSLAFLQLIRKIRTLELGTWTIEYDRSLRSREMPIETVSFYL